MSTASAAPSAGPAAGTEAQIKQNRALMTPRQQELARIVLEAYDAFARGDWQTAFTAWSPDCVIESNVGGSQNLPWQGRWPQTGPEAFVQFSKLKRQHLAFASRVLQVVPGADDQTMLVLLSVNVKTPAGAELRDSLVVHFYRFNSDNQVVLWQDTSDTGSQVALLDGRYMGNADQSAELQYVGESSFQGDREEQVKVAKQWYEFLSHGDVPGILGLFSEDSYTVSNYPGYQLCPYNDKFGPGSQGHLQFIVALTGVCEPVGSASYVVPADHNVVIASWDGIIRGKTSRKQIRTAHAFHIFTFNADNKIKFWTEVVDSATDRDVIDGKIGHDAPKESSPEETKEGTN